MSCMFVPVFCIQIGEIENSYAEHENLAQPLCYTEESFRIMKTTQNCMSFTLCFIAAASDVGLLVS